MDQLNVCKVDQDTLQSDIFTEICILHTCGIDPCLIGPLRTCSYDELDVLLEALYVRVLQMDASYALQKNDQFFEFRPYRMFTKRC